MKTIRSMKGFLCYLTGVVFVATAVLLLSGCMDPLGRESTAAAGISVMNAPSTVTELELTVSGPGMSTIQRTLTPGTSSITLEVPVGVNRLFDITGGWFTFRRSFSVSPAGLSVPANMGSYIVVDDTANGRVVRFRDLNGTGWSELEELQDLSDLDLIGFDREGRLIFFVVSFSPSNTAVRSLESPTSAQAEQVWELEGVTITTPPAFDRNANRLYFVRLGEGLGIQYLDLGEEEPELVTLWPYSANLILATVVADDGYLYVASGVPTRIDKVSLSTGVVTRSFVYNSETTGQENLSPLDMTYVNGSLFVINRQGSGTVSDGNAVFQFNSNLSLVGRFGSFPQDTDNPQPGEFFRARRFVATVPRRLIVVDSYRDWDEDVYVNRLVAFNDIGTAGWRTFGRTGTDEGEFRFFAC